MWYLKGLTDERMAMSCSYCIFGKSKLEMVLYSTLWEFYIVVKVYFLFGSWSITLYGNEKAFDIILIPYTWPIASG